MHTYHIQTINPAAVTVVYHDFSTVGERPGFTTCEIQVNDDGLLTDRISFFIPLNSRISALLEIKA